MTIAFQFALLALIATSFLPVVGVPVAFASFGGWSGSRNIGFSGRGPRYGLD